MLQVVYAVDVLTRQKVAIKKFLNNEKAFKTELVSYDDFARVAPNE